jgi:hypothetical protein
MMAIERNFTESIPTVVTAKPVVSYFVEWGSQKEKYCQKNFVCRHPSFPFKNETNEIVITADPRQVTPGGPVIVNKYRLTNMTDVPRNDTHPGRVMLQMHFPDPVIELAFYVRADGNISRLAFEPLTVNTEELEKSFNFFGEVLEEMRERDLKTARIETIRIAVERMEAGLAPESGVKDPKFQQIWDQIDEYKRKIADGTYARMSMQSLKRVIEEIELVATFLGFKVEH